MAHPRHAEVRQRYGRACAYCGATEADAGGELTVDHYRPVSAGGDDSADNLVYACFRCNTYKGDFYPSPEDQRLGHRILHPLLDNVSLHLREDPRTCAWEPLTETGRFHILALRLNRPQLIEYRRRLRLHDVLHESLRLLKQENESLRQRLALVEEYLHRLRLQGKEDTDSPEKGPE